MSDSSPSNHTDEAEAEDKPSLRRRLTQTITTAIDLIGYLVRALALNFKVGPVTSSMLVASSIFTGLQTLGYAWFNRIGLNRLAWAYEHRVQLNREINAELTAHHPGFWGGFANVYDDIVRVVPVIWPYAWGFLMVSAIWGIAALLSTGTSALRNVQRLALDNAVQDRLNTHVVMLDLATQESSEFQSNLQRISGSGYEFYSTLDTIMSVVSGVVALGSAGFVLWRFSSILIVLFVLITIPGFFGTMFMNVLSDRLWSKHGHEYMLRYRMSSLLHNHETGTELKLNAAVKHIVDLTRGYRVSWSKRQRKLARQTSMIGIGDDLLEQILEGGVTRWLIVKMLVIGFGIGTMFYYVELCRSFSSALGGLIGEVSQCHSTALDLRAYYKIIDLEPTIVSPPNARRIPAGHRPTIEFRNVGFTYEGSDKPVLKGVNLTIHAGDKLAIVGANGSGKSTLFKLLLRLYDPTEGQILVDGHDLREYSVEDWRAALGVLHQDFNKYALSARDNIQLGKIDVEFDDERAGQAITDAEAQAVIESFTDGLNTMLSRIYDDGVVPSGGQWQRLALARLLYRWPSIMVLDEPTSAIDAAAEAEIFGLLFGRTDTRTVIVISHRFTTVCNAQRIIMLADGQVVADGEPQKLIASEDNAFSRLFASQKAAMLVAV